MTIANPGSVYDWSITPANNATTDASINWQEFQDPATVNNSARQVMSRVNELISDIAPTRSSTWVTPNAYLVTSTSVPSTGTLPNGFMVSFIAHAANTGPCTLAVNSFGSSALRGQSAVNLAVGQIQAGMKITAFFNKAANEFIADGTGAASGAYLSAFQSADIQARIIKVGMVQAWPGDTVPNGWLEANGRAISRTTYAELFAAYGVIYGPGDGSTTFNLPDYRGMFLRGWDHGRTQDPDASARYNRGDGTVGDRVGTTQPDSTRSHTHASGTLVNGSDTHSHTLPVSNQIFPPGGGGANVILSGGTTATSSYTHTHVISGSTEAFGGNETRPGNINVMWCVLALPAAAAAGALGVIGLQYRFGTFSAAAADPGTGTFSVSGADLTATHTGTLYISATEQTLANVGLYIATILTGQTAKINKVGVLSTFSVLTFSGPAVAAGGGAYYTIPYTVTASGGTFVGGDQIGLLLSGPAGIPGPVGPTGPAGGVVSITAGAGLAGGTVTGTGTFTLDLARVNAWTGQQYSALQTLTDGATIAWNLNTQQAATVTIAGNRTLSNPTNMAAGSRYSLFVVQDATGGRTLAYGANYIWLGGTTPAVATAANAVSRLDFVSDGTNIYGSMIGSAGLATLASTAVTHTSSSTAASATTAQKKLDRELNLVDDFGGVGDDATANDTALTNFIAAVSAGVPGYIPPGIYRTTTAALSATPTGAFKIRGAGAKSVIKRMNNLTSPLLVINSAVNPIVSDMQFLYAGAIPYGLITGATQANPCVITCAAGHPFTNGQTISVYDVIGMPQINGSFTVAGVAGNTFQLSGINSTGYAAYVAGGDVSLSNMGDHIPLRFNLCTDAVLENTTLAGAWWVGAEGRDCDGLIFNGNKVTNNGDRGLYVQITSTNVSRKIRIVNNAIDGGGLMFYGINTNVAATATEQDVMISSNTVYNTVYQGLAVSGAANGVISGNIIDTVSSVNSGVGILIQTTNTLADKFITCTGNTIVNAAIGISEITGQNNLISSNSINCTASNSLFGIQLSGSLNPTVTGNKIRSTVNNVTAILCQTNGATAALGAHIFGNHLIMTGTGTTGILTDGTSTGNMAQNYFNGPATNMTVAGTWTFGDAVVLNPPGSALQVVKTQLKIDTHLGAAVPLILDGGTYQPIQIFSSGTYQGAFGYNFGLYIQNNTGYNTVQFSDATSGATVSVNAPVLTTGATGSDVTLSSSSTGTAADANVNLGLTAKGAGVIKINNALRLTAGQQNTAKNIAVPTTGGTVTLSAALPEQIINPAGTLAALTVTLPASPVDGQMQYVTFTQVITALTVNGGTTVGAPTAIALTNAGAGFAMIYNSGDSKWYRCQ